jgi:hypothetical protein
VSWIPERQSKLIHFSINLQSTSSNIFYFFIISSSFSRNVGGNCDNLPRKIPHYRLNQSTLVIKQ